MDEITFIVEFIILLYLIMASIYHIKRTYRSSRLMRLYGKATPLNRGTPNVHQNGELDGTSNSILKGVSKGDYVAFEGVITHPNDTTPYASKPCSIYVTKIWAEFKTKLKKPEKGTQTHRTVIYTDSNENQPIILDSSVGVIHCLFNDISSILLQPETIEHNATHLPLKEAEPAVLPKYEKYELRETFFPKNVMLSGLATVLDTHKNGVTLSGGVEKTLPPLLATGTLNQLQPKLKKRFLFDLFYLLLLAPTPLLLTIYNLFPLLTPDWLVRPNSPLAMTGIYIAAVIVLRLIKKIGGP